MYHLNLNNMNFLYLLMMGSSFFLSSAHSNAQKSIKNAENRQVSVKGNCPEAKQLIETAGNLKHTATVHFDASSQTASITYDSTKTSSDEVLKRIALAGFDNEAYFAPDDAFERLGDACRYVRDKVTDTSNKNNSHTLEEHAAYVQKQNELQSVFDVYFKLKDAFVQGNASGVQQYAVSLSKALEDVDMEKLSHEAHTVWMQKSKQLITLTKQLTAEKNIDKQRKTFAGISEELYSLAKVAKLGENIYYQTCPMFNGGSQWLSREESIKNPFYGNKMLSCGSTIETIKK